MLYSLRSPQNCPCWWHLWELEKGKSCDLDTQSFCSAAMATLGVSLSLIPAFELRMNESCVDTGMSFEYENEGTGQCPAATPFYITSLQSMCRVSRSLSQTWKSVIKEAHTGNMSVYTYINTHRGNNIYTQSHGFYQSIQVIFKRCIMKLKPAWFCKWFAWRFII